MKDQYIVKPQKEHPLKNVWNDFPEFLEENSDVLTSTKIEDLIGQMFLPGEFYYYIINFADSTLSNYHKNILTMHGLKKYPEHLKEIIGLVHPEAGKPTK